MQVRLTDEQEMLKSVFGRLFKEKSTPGHVRDSGAAGHDPQLWAELVAMGAPLMRVDGEQGGGELSLLSAAIIAEEAGVSVASVPLIEVIVAGRLLSRVGDPGRDHVRRLGDGESIITLALSPVDAATSQIVPAGAVSDAVIALRGDALVLVEGQGGELLPNTGNLPLARWTLGEGTVLAKGADAVALYQQAVEEWRLLVTAFLLGAAGQALVMAAEYANERRQFDRPIGSFQGLAHPMADSYADVEAGRLLAWRAIDAIARGDARAAGLASLSYWWATQASSMAVHRAIRALGGYGLSLEYDLQLYHRRVTGLILSAGDPFRSLAEGGDRLFGAGQVALPDAGEATMSFALPEESQKLADDLTAFFKLHRTPEMAEKAHHSTSSHNKEFHRKLAQAGFLFGTWPTAKASATPASNAYAIASVIEAEGYTTHVISTTDMVGQIVQMFGTEEAKAEVVPAVLAGEAMCSLGFSEPSSGSDVFSASTRAVPDGDEWIINGSKMFTTAAHYADYVLLLARTDTSGRKHEGLTMFIVPTRLPGFSYQAVQTYQDERTNLTYYADIRLPDRYRLGKVNGGAAVMGAMLMLEHSAAASMYVGFTEMMKAADVWANTPVDGRKPVDDPVVRTRYAAVVARYEAAGALVARNVWGADAGIHSRAWGPMGKMFVTESYLDSAWELLKLGAPESGLTGKHAQGVIELGHRRAYGSTIYGGTSEVHRSLTAEQGLGLPKSRS
jgi:alkylation response protein AidB-like acyl-CoA dehydrogenase